MARTHETFDARPAAPAGADHDATVACPRCGRVQTWGALARTQVLDGAALESHLAVPPNGWFVDVRTCSGCGRPLARKAVRRDG